VNRRLCALIAAVVATRIAACGGGGDGNEPIHEDALRDCLGKHGVAIGDQQQGVTGFAPVFHVAADFQGSIGGTAINVFIEKTEDRARRDAADAEGALSTVGVQNPSDNVVANRNVVIVFDRPPSDETEATVRACMS
jgi:hypothetical protein